MKNTQGFLGFPPGGTVSKNETVPGWVEVCTPIGTASNLVGFGSHHDSFDIDILSIFPITRGIF